MLSAAGGGGAKSAPPANSGPVAPTSANFFAAVLQRLKLPVTTANLDALYAVEHLEGNSSRYNPLNVIQPEPGSTAFNSVGVQTYASFDTGVAGTATLLSNSHWAGVRQAFAQGNSLQADLAAFQQAYTWDPGISFPATPAIFAQEAAWNVGPRPGSAGILSGIVAPSSAGGRGGSQSAGGPGAGNVAAAPGLPFPVGSLSGNLSATQRTKIVNWLEAVGNTPQALATWLTSSAPGAPFNLRLTGNQSGLTAYESAGPSGNVYDQYLIDAYNAVGKGGGIGYGAGHVSYQWNMPGGGLVSQIENAAEDVLGWLAKPLLKFFIAAALVIVGVIFVVLAVKMLADSDSSSSSSAPVEEEAPEEEHSEEGGAAEDAVAAA